MTDRNFAVPSEDPAGAPLFLTNRGRLLDIDGNYSLSPSPDSAGCNFNLSERADCTSPDISVLSSGGPIMLPNNTPMTLPQGKLVANLENTFIATPEHSSINFWNDSLSLLGCQVSEGNKTFYTTASEGSSSAAVSPDSLEMSSCRTSCRGSMDLSFSSAEMVVRSNSFVVEEQASVLSSLEDSPAPSVSSHVESKSLLTSLNEMCGAGDQAGKQPCFGMTFVLGDKVELPSEENEAMCNSSYLALPGEKDGHHATCKSLPTDFTNDIQFIYSESKLRNESEPLNQASHRGSEMVLQDSFVLQEQAAPSVMSSIEESPAPPTLIHVEENSLSTSLSADGGAGDQMVDNPCFGMTFLMGEKVELQSEEDGGICGSFLALPGEGGLRTTFLYENSPSDIANDARFIYSEVELLNESTPLATPDQAKTFAAPLCSVQDNDKDIHTSTPVQNLGSHLPSLPSFAVSPCTENTGSPSLRPVLRKKSSATPKVFEKGTPISGNKGPKLEVNKLPKSDMSNVKCTAILKKPIQMNTKQEGSKVVSRPSPTKMNSSTATPVPKTVHNPQRKMLDVGTNKDQVNLQRISAVSEELQVKSKMVHGPLKIEENKQSPDTEQGASSQANADPKAHGANATFCYPEKSPPENDKKVQKTAPNKITNKIKKVKSGSALGHEKSNPNLPKPRPRSSSESGNALSRLFKMATSQRISASFSLTKSKTENPKSQKKPGTQDTSRTKPGPAKETIETSGRKVKKIVLASDPNTSSAAPSAEAKTKVRGQLSQNQTVRASASMSPAASSTTATPFNKHQSGASGSSRTLASLGTPLPKNKNSSNRQSLGATPTANKPSSSLNLRTPSRPSLMGPPPTPVSRLQPRKTFGPTRSLSGTSESGGAHSETSDSKVTPVSSGVGRRATPFKVPIFKSRLATTPAKTSAPVLTPCKSTAPTKSLTNGHTSPQNRTTSTATKLFRLTASVDKNKPKVGSRPQQQQQQSDRGLSRTQQGPGAQDGGPAGVSEARRNAANTQNLQTQLTRSDNRFEALAVVLQQTLAQRDEAVGQRRGLSQELLELRGELVSSVNRSECLVQEKESLKVALQEALDQVQAQHQRDLEELEQRLREAHDSERRAAEQRSREERERSTQALQQQLQELEVAHEAQRLNLEQSHSLQLQRLEQQHQLSLQELSTSHTQELQALSKTLKDAETVLNEKIRQLTQENKALMEKLAEEENRRKEMSQKDSHTLYLEKELESLKVVLDMKTQQLHQQEKKLVEVDKLTEKSLKLGEILTKVQQENEDLKARMDRHAALSRQLSTEQALLQESLHKESKMNKRLSMENEELMWKLHNGESPRMSSPNGRSPSPHFSLQSPRSPALFSSPPVSPR